MDSLLLLSPLSLITQGYWSRVHMGLQLVVHGVLTSFFNFSTHQPSNHERGGDGWSHERRTHGPRSAHQSSSLICQQPASWSRNSATTSICSAMLIKLCESKMRIFGVGWLFWSRNLSQDSRSSTNCRLRFAGRWPPLLFCFLVVLFLLHVFVLIAN